jgi:vacuolar-type H+-ATPase subunit E/Vma4
MLNFRITQEVEEEIKRIIKILDDQINELEYEEEREIDKIKRGDELPPCLEEGRGPCCH